MTARAIRLSGLVLLLQLWPCQASYCTGGPSADWTPNTYEVTVPVLTHVADWTNRTVGPRGPTITGGGRLYRADHAAANASFPVLHLYGSPYDMGYAHGTLLRNESTAMMDAFWSWLVQQAGGSEAAVEALIVPIQVRGFAPRLTASTGGVLGIGQGGR